MTDTNAIPILDHSADGAVIEEILPPARRRPVADG